MKNIMWGVLWAVWVTIFGGVLCKLCLDGEKPKEMVSPYETVSPMGTLAIVDSVKFIPTPTIDWEKVRIVPTNTLTIDSEGKWFIKISPKDGLVFNRKDFPNWEPDKFALEFVKAMKDYLPPCEK